MAGPLLPQRDPTQSERISLALASSPLLSWQHVFENRPGMLLHSPEFLPLIESVRPNPTVKDLLVPVTVVQDVFSQQQIQVVMAIFMNDVIDEIEVVSLEAVDEGEARPVTIAEADDARGVQRYDPRREQLQ